MDGMKLMTPGWPSRLGGGVFEICLFLLSRFFLLSDPIWRPINHTQFWFVFFLKIPTCSHPLAPILRSGMFYCNGCLVLQVRRAFSSPPLQSHVALLIFWIFNRTWSINQLTSLVSVYLPSQFLCFFQNSFFLPSTPSSHKPTLLAVFFPPKAKPILTDQGKPNGNTVCGQPYQPGLSLTSWSPGAPSPSPSSASPCSRSPTSAARACPSRRVESSLRYTKFRGFLVFNFYIFNNCRFVVGNLRVRDLDILAATK